MHSLTNTQEVNQGKDLDTVFCQETCFLATQVIVLTDIFVILGLQFTQLVLKSAAQLFKVSLVRQERSSSAGVHFQHVCIDFKDVMKENTTQCIVYLCLSNSLHVAGEVINFHFVFTLFLLKLLLDTLEIVNLLSQLSNTVSLLLAESGSGGFMLQSGLLKVPTELLELSFTLLVHLNLSSSGATGFL